MTKWKGKTEQVFTHDEIEKTFIINRQSNVNMYRRFIQFRFSITGPGLGIWEKFSAKFAFSKMNSLVIFL